MSLKIKSAVAVAALFLSQSAAAASTLPNVAGIPIDFILFALTLLGVALFHNHTLAVGLTGLFSITLYKLSFIVLRIIYTRLGLSNNYFYLSCVFLKDPIPPNYLSS